ncbi:glutathione S-transferase family protein [Chitinilyticum litopenaei]|uniref:glutathione S-transferase family protein n=1 Tax=Chitinilyticum litopenaei TaxID=1121276 RepID=UPI0003F704C8|nr:glutathione S-transferase family protein [Chitinilyticum litopenaei]
MNTNLTLISHRLCPFVQRAVIALEEKGVAYTRRDIDLANKPDWFLAVSPLGKTPVLLVGDEPLFESAVICEYLEETTEDALHPADPLRRAQHRGWIEYSSALLNAIAAYYSAPDEAALQAAASDLDQRLARLEQALGDGPYFAGAAFSLVDAAFGPVFRYFSVFERLGVYAIPPEFARIRAWAQALAARESVAAAVASDYAEQLVRFLEERKSELARRITAAALAA